MRTTLFDAEGAVTTDVARARTAELVTTDALGEELRVYGTVGDVPSVSEAGNPDHTDDEAADWVKAGTWDVYVQTDGVYRLAESLEDLRGVLNLDLSPLPAQRVQLANLMLLPVWESMPQRIRDEISAFLVDTRPA